MIGLLLCRNQNRLVAEYALSGIDKPMGVAEGLARLLLWLQPMVFLHRPIPRSAVRLEDLCGKTRRPQEFSRRKR